MAYICRLKLRQAAGNVSVFILYSIQSNVISESFESCCQFLFHVSHFQQSPFQPMTFMLLTRKKLKPSSLDLNFVKPCLIMLQFVWIYDKISCPIYKPQIDWIVRFCPDSKKVYLLFYSSIFKFPWYFCVSKDSRVLVVMLLGCVS